MSAERDLGRWIRNSESAEMLADRFEDFLETDPSDDELRELFEAVAKRLMSDEKGDEIE